MKIDELIQELEEVKEEHGNLQIKLQIPTFGQGTISGVETRGQIQHGIHAWLYTQLLD